MSLILCTTGPMDSGKSTLCDMLRELESNSLGFESGQLITELANELNTYLSSDHSTISEGDNFYEAFNAALSAIEKNHPELLGEDVDINFTAKDLLEHPKQFQNLEQYLETIRMQPTLINTRITIENRDIFYRPLLKWLGGYMVYKVRPSVWFDEIGRRIIHFKPTPALVTVSSLRFPADEEAMRSFCEKNKFDCLIVEVQRPGMSEGTDVTEMNRSEIRADTLIINNGIVEDLRDVAKDLLHDISKKKLKPEYRSR